MKSLKLSLFLLTVFNLTGISLAALAESPPPHNSASVNPIAQRNTEPDCEEDERNAAGECETEIPEIEFLEITVTANRAARLLLDTAASITVIDSEEIEQRVIQDIRDLVRYEPGVSVGSNPNRFGNQGFNIRGIDGNRILIQVDGIPTADNYVGRGRDFFNLETIERVEIIKGPASALYGSDAIGGVVSFITKDPEDYLGTFGEPIYTSLSTTYDSTNEGQNTTGVLAVEDETGTLQASATLTIGDSSEFKNFGNIRSNPQEINELSFLGKVVYNFDENNSLRFTGEFLDSKIDTNLINEQGRTPLDVSRPPFFVFFNREISNAEDRRSRNRLSLDYSYNNEEAAWLQTANLQLYYQNSQIEEEKISQGIRIATSPFGRPQTAPIRRIDRNEFEQNVLGGEVQLESSFSTGSLDHRLVYGIEVYNTATSRPRDSSIINLTNNSETKFVAGEAFPNKTFPDTNTFRLGIYLQDEIEIGNFSIIPGLRWDYYSLNANEDADFARINVDNFKIEDLNESAISPKVGIVYRVSPELSFYGQYARGFRSPPYDDANIGFTNFAFGYTVLPNAQLEPETSDSFELGMRGSYDNLGFSVAGFYNNYNNFIDTVGLGRRSRDNFLQFQSQNIEQAEIYGLEAQAEYFFTNRREGFSLFGNFAWSEGNNTSQGETKPLNSINPLEAVLGLRYRAPEERWGVELLTNLVGKKERIDGDNLFAPEGYMTVDLIGYYNLSERLSLSLGLFNIFNQKYFVWSDVRGLTAGSDDLERFAQPAFNATASIRFRF
ncbi:MAG: TonB-dependent hemoglobin/transferrin/lactoferrin family receptor [Spirulinaceae cyanobacterium]